jgi:AmmeMemoRadiSam system protein B
MSHQVNQKTAKRLDFIAIDAILKLDEEALYHSVEKHRISMCGYQATTAALAAAKGRNAEKAELILYQTSGDATGDMDNVVGYAGIRVL